MKDETTIFDLYKKEKLISHTDDQGRKVEILLIKMTHRERRKALDKYTEVLEEEREKLKARDEKANLSTLEPVKKEQLVDSVATYEQVQRESYLDLFPIKEEKDLSQEQKAKVHTKTLEKWKISRRKELSELSIHDLQNRLLEISRESVATIEAGRAFDFACLFFMCREPKEEHKRIFSSVEDVENVQDSRIITWLLKELAEFRKLEAAKEVREAAESPPFDSSGASQKDSTASQLSKE